MNLLLKSIFYRIFASGITFAISYIFTGNILISTGISIFEFIGKTFSYWLYDVIWQKITKCLKKNAHIKPKCYWLSGLNSSGKTTTAKELLKLIPNTVHLDGDVVRQSINYDLGFQPVDITKNLTKVANLSKLLLDQGFNVIVSCISKYKSDRKHAKDIIGDKQYIEIYVTCEKSLLKQRQNIIHKNTKVIQTDYEKSDYETITVDTSKLTPKECAKIIYENN